MLSSSAKYGIRAITYIASKAKKNEMLGIKTISENLSLPTPFLAKILQQLARQKILSSSKGPHGGFALLRDPKTITLFEIIISIDGPDLFENCVVHNTTCKCVDSEKLICTLHDEYSKIRRDMIRLFRKKTIYNLVKAAEQGEDIRI